MCIRDSGRRIQRRDAYKPLACIGSLQRLVNLRSRRLSRQQSGLEQHCGGHAAVEVAHYGAEHRRHRQTADGLHLRQVLVVLV